MDDKIAKAIKNIEKSQKLLNKIEERIIKKKKRRSLMDFF